MTDRTDDGAYSSGSSARLRTDVVTWFAGPTAVLLVISTFVAWGRESFQAQTGSWIAVALLVIIAFVNCGRRRSLWLCAPLIAIAAATVAMLVWVRQVTADETDNAQTTAGVSLSIAVCAVALLVASWAARRRARGL